MVQITAVMLRMLRNLLEQPELHWKQSKLILEMQGYNTTQLKMASFTWNVFCSVCLPPQSLEQRAAGWEQTIKLYQPAAGQQPPAPTSLSQPPPP